MRAIESDEMPDLTPDFRRYRVVLAPAGGWDVIVEHDHRIVSIIHCTEWHRVERCAIRFTQPVAVQCRLTA